MRLACLLIPLFPLAARLRSEPELAHEAVAIFEGNGHAARVVAATRPARRAGIRPGLTLPQTRALLPNLVARGRDAECERTAQETLLETVESFSPRVEDGGDGIAYIDISGLERHFPGDDPELQLGRALMTATEAAGIPAWVGIASSKLAARVAAEQPHPPTTVPSGSEADFLAPLPLGRLCPETEVAATLHRWGIRSIGALARLAAAEVASRLGPVGQELHTIARGIDPRPLIPREPPASYREGMGMEWPLTNLEPFLFLGRAALERLCRRLESRGLACACLELSLRLEPQGYHERTLRLPAPTREVKTLLTLIRLDLEAHPPAAPVTGFTFLAHPGTLHQAQLSLFGPTTLSPDRLATTLARLFTLLGSHRLGSPRPVDSHRPESFVLMPYEPPKAPTVRPEAAKGRGLLAVRALRPAVPLQVLTTAPADDGSTIEPPTIRRPVEVKAVVDSETNRQPRIEGRVRVASGPWLLEESWWAERPVEREYWDVELAQGGIYRIFRDRRSGEWFADGVYD